MTCTASSLRAFRALGDLPCDLQWVHHAPSEKIIYVIVAHCLRSLTTGRQTRIDTRRIGKTATAFGNPRKSVADSTDARLPVWGGVQDGRHLPWKMPRRQFPHAGRPSALWCRRHRIKEDR